MICLPSHAQEGVVATINAFEADGLLGRGSGSNITLFNMLTDLAEGAAARLHQLPFDVVQPGRTE